MASVMHLAFSHDEPPTGELPASPTPLFELPVHEGFVPYNRRSLPRVRRSFSVRDVHTGEQLRGIDLSFGGLMVQSPEPVWPGNQVALELRLERCPAVVIYGRVVELVSHRGQFAMRVRFEDVSPEGRRAIAMWMARVRP